MFSVEEKGASRARRVSMGGGGEKREYSEWSVTRHQRTSKKKRKGGEIHGTSDKAKWKQMSASMHTHTHMYIHIKPKRR